MWLTIRSSISYALLLAIGAASTPSSAATEGCLFRVERFLSRFKKEGQTGSTKTAAPLFSKKTSGIPSNSETPLEFPMIGMKGFKSSENAKSSLRSLWEKAPVRFLPDEDLSSNRTYENYVEELNKVKAANPEFEGMAVEDYIALSQYQGRLHEKVNRALRNKDARLLNLYRPYIECLASALNHLPVFTGEPLTRRAIMPAEVVSRFRKSEQITEHGFLSTSKHHFEQNALVDERFTVFKIRSKSGKYISGNRAGSEEEILFLPGAKFKVTENRIETVPAHYYHPNETTRVWVEEKKLRFVYLDEI
jgi:hypothetical protein